MYCPAAGSTGGGNLNAQLSSAERASVAASKHWQTYTFHIHLLRLPENERKEKYPASRIDDDGKQFTSGLCCPKLLLMARLLVSLGGIIVANKGE